LSRLGANVEQAVKHFLEKEHIGYVSVSHRVKQLDRFLEKIARKGYHRPFKQTKDLVGIRIVCFFQSDVSRIADLLSQEFNVIRDRNKEEALPPTQFGYRSHHLLLRINRDWGRSPNYRGLEGFVVEIQIRTVLMHAWAEIEHRLAYKRKEHIPGQFRRKFSMLSAKLEEADEQFEELASAIADLKGEIREQTAKKSSFDRNLTLNLDTLQAFLDIQHPDDHRSMRQTRALLDELLSRKKTIGDLVDDYASEPKNYQDQDSPDVDSLVDSNQVDSARRILRLNDNRECSERRSCSKRTSEKTSEETS